MKKFLCPFCLSTLSDEKLHWQCAAGPQKCAQRPNSKLTKIWGITTPQAHIFKEKKAILSHGQKCPKCATTTYTRCCGYCAKTLPEDLLSKNHSHITCITSNHASAALFYQSVYKSIEQSVGQQSNLILQSPPTTKAPFILRIQGVNQAAHSFVFNILTWEQMADSSTQPLLTESSMYAIFLPFAPPSPIMPVLHLLSKHLKQSKPVAFILEECESVLAHIPPNHIFFRHMPHYGSYQKKASLALSQTFKDLVAPLWSANALQLINKNFPLNHFFVNTAHFSNNSLTTPQGWKIDEFTLWLLNH